MRKILYKKRQSLERGRKIISIIESSNEKDYKTQVKKNFIYLVSSDEHTNMALDPPNIFITKYFNSKTKEEKFHFKVKGAFYMGLNDETIKVEFRHSLNIIIKWKNKKFSPKKSATLT